MDLTGQVAKRSAFWSRRFSRPAKNAKPAVSGIGSQSNTNSASSKSTVFRIGNNQIHPKETLLRLQTLSRLFLSVLSPPSISHRSESDV